MGQELERVLGKFLFFFLLVVETTTLSLVALKKKEANFQAFSGSGHDPIG